MGDGAYPAADMTAFARFLCLVVAASIGPIHSQGWSRRSKAMRRLERLRVLQAFWLARYEQSQSAPPAPRRHTRASV